MSDIAYRYRKLREVNNLNQRDFAAKIGINQSSLSDIEKGKTRPSIETVIATSKTFGVTTDWILLGSKVAIGNPKLNELLNLFSQLSLTGKEDILNFLKLKNRQH